MCFIRLEHFTGVLLFFYILLSIPLSSVIRTESIPVNTSEEIKNIFRDIHINDHKSVPVLKGKSNYGNFAEGGVINGAITNLTSTTEKAINNLQNLTNTHLSVKEYNVQNRNKSVNVSDSDSIALKNQLLNKLNETGSNLFLGVPEVVHINGTSSIKPRKGVYFNKIVPRKGVDNENEGTHPGMNSSCFQINDEECYNVQDKHDLDCECCEKGNSLGSKIKEQSPLNCKTCTPINLISNKEKLVCKNICCQKKLVGNDTYSVSTTEDILDSYTYYKNHKKENVSSVESPQSINNTSDSKKSFDGGKSYKNSTKHLKHKPTITKVPYDVEVVTELLSKAKQKVFVPIVVSIFLLPLIGMLMYFVWRRTKDYWDKRHYRKMDFLIDGMYND